MFITTLVYDTAHQHGVKGGDTLLDSIKLLYLNFHKTAIDL